MPPNLRGTYAGLAVKEVVDYIKSLGVTSVELLPVHAFVQDQHLIDKGRTWGKSPGVQAVAERSLTRSGR